MAELEQFFRLDRAALRQVDKAVFTLCAVMHLHAALRRRDVFAADADRWSDLRARAGKAANWSDGPTCRTCLDKATRCRGRCPGCHRSPPTRPRPERGSDLPRLRRITRSFFCDRCTLTDKVTAALDDGTGHISPALRPLADTLIAMPDPWTGWMWLRHQHNQDLLADLATGRVPVTHQALHQVPNWRTAAYLRDLLSSPPSTSSSCASRASWPAAATTSMATRTNGSCTPSPPGTYSPSSARGPNNAPSPQPR
ncbi:hypothetical protein ACSNOI_31855 [Actinomadura kijaniata]|uniref:hypothetical protein n=1 Tax=Actinomadura kijaniata TaxID=46161 RepID=UPI003F1C3729